MSFSFLEPARDEFSLEVQRAILRVLRDPSSFERISENIHRCRTRRFPYAVLYAIEGQEVVIVAVMHLHREPDYWIDRLNG